jgi:hypothetical protein
MLEMHVRVDAARHDDMSGCVDQLLGGVARQRSGSGDRGDRLAGDRDVAAHDALGGHHIAAANDEIKHSASWRRQGACLAQALIDAVFLRVHARNKAAGF